MTASPLPGRLLDAAPQGLDRASWPFAVGLAVIGAMLGLLAGYDPRIAIAGALGLAFVLVAFADLAIGLAVFAFIGFVEVVPLFGPVLNLTKLAGLLLTMSWFAILTTRQSSKIDFVSVHPIVAAALGLFLGWATLSAAWAEDPGAAVGSASRYALNMVLFLIVFTAVRVERDLGHILIGFVLGSLFAVGYALVAPSAEDPGRLATAAHDPNELAAALISGSILAVGAVAFFRGSPALRLLGGFTAVACVAGILLTASRGGLIALTVALLFAIVVAGRWRAPLAIGAACLATASVIYFAGFAPPEVQERITEPVSGQSRVQEGRTTIWQVAWRSVEANPVQGLGSANFAVSSKHYLLEPGTLARTDEIIDEPKVAHNSYLEILAELGIVGAFLFGVVIIFAVASALTAARRYKTRGDPRMQAVCLCVSVAVVGLLAAGFFLSGQYSKELWLLLGLGPALLAMSSRAGPTSDGLQGSPTHA